MSVADLQGKATAQVNIISSIPARVFSLWPGAITLAIIEYATVMVIDALPNPGGGMTGQVVNSLIRSAADLTKFVTYDAIKTVF